MKLSIDEADVLANTIAERIFVNGNGDHAKRLVLELENGGDGGGWCKQSVVDVIRDSFNEVLGETL